MRRRSRRLHVTLLVSAASLLLTANASGQATEPATRAEQIALERNQKQATLWPERENPMVVRANGLLDRGLGEGIRSGEGANGWQLLLSGTRPAQGQTVGVGYRRSDLLHDAVATRATVRGTIHGALLIDGQLQINRFKRSADSFFDFYTKYERSPRMEYYGLGRDSNKANRSRYLLGTFSAQARGGYRFTRSLNAGIDASVGRVHTGPVGGGSVPSIETIFDASTAPGLFDDATFLGLGAFVGYDTRDVPRGPRSGSFFGASLDRNLDLSHHTYTHRQLGLDGQHFFPYFNKTRVVAVFVSTRFAFTGRQDRVVPFYLLPTLGGNFELRGFSPYRYHDNNAFVTTLEHRWYAFTGLEMAVFVDAGKTVASKDQVDFSGLNYSGGVGFRARLKDAIVLRFDVARSREGLRWIWSISDVSRRKF